MKPLSVLLFLTLAAGLRATPPPDFSGTWELVPSASDDLQIELRHRRSQYQFDQLRAGRGPRVPSNPPRPGAPPPLIAPQPPGSQGSTPPATTPGSTPPTNVSFGTRSDGLASLFEAAAESGAGAGNLVVSRQKGDWTSLEDGRRVLWTFDGKRPTLTTRRSRLRGKKMLAELTLIDGSRIDWTWGLLKDGRLRVTVRIQAIDSNDGAYLDPLVVRSVYSRVVSDSDAP